MMHENKIEGSSIGQISFGAQMSQAAAVPEREQHLALLREASAQIHRMNQEREVLLAKVSTMELLAGLGRDQGRNYGGMAGAGRSTDVLWQIDRLLERERNTPQPTQPVCGTEADGPLAQALATSSGVTG